MPEFYKIFKNKFKISDLRAIYTTKILEVEGYFKDRKGEKEIYHRVALILGHKIGEGETIGASFNYRDFCITKSSVIEDLKDKLEYIKQYREIEISKQMSAFLNKKIATGQLVDISYASDTKKIRIDNATFTTMSNALQDAIDTLKSHDSNLLNKNSLNTTFRRILEQEYGYDVKNNGRKTIRFIDKFLRIEKRRKIKLKAMPLRKRYTPAVIRNLIIPKEIHTLLKELESNAKESTVILRENSHILQFILEKILIERERQINILNYDLLNKTFHATKDLSKIRFKKITQVILASIDRLKEAIMISHDNTISAREQAEAEEGFTSLAEDGIQYYKAFVIEEIIIPNLHKMLLRKLKISKSAQYSALLTQILHALLIKRANIKEVLKYESLEATFNSTVVNTKNKFSKEKFKRVETIIKDNLKEIQNQIIFNPQLLIYI
ncbi:hypothetical protein [Candidatus Borreliella tachyglossi]|uniref:hypothetical protein n=1 Tax=Candidatus Borreliella tachyglossi TaxID=1964448 RepID=UPI004041C6FC